MDETMLSLNAEGLICVVSNTLIENDPINGSPFSFSNFSLIVVESRNTYCSLSEVREILIDSSFCLLKINRSASGCQSLLKTIVIHGHEQCYSCKSNIFECCSGDVCETDYNLKFGFNRF